MKKTLINYLVLVRRNPTRLISTRKIQTSVAIAVVILAMLAVHRLAVANSEIQPLTPKVIEAGTAPEKISPATTFGNLAQQGDVQAELLTIRPYGFEPDHITRPKGQFFLAVENRSQVESLSLSFSHVAGQRFQELRVQRGRPDTSSMVDLPIGDYILTEASHPEWICKLTISR